jgi:spore coat polysaccharide biosynthesis predicted glycosyltransferase SpsG
VTARPLVHIFCDANETIGYGHVRRSLTLASRLEEDGFNVRLTGLSDGARRLLPPESQAAVDSQIVLFDSHVGIDCRIRDAVARRATTITLDWFGATLPHINIAVYAHTPVRSTVKSYVGFEYVLIRSEILEVPRKAFSGRAERVVVVIGGSDVLGLGQEAAQHLYATGLDVTLIQGPLAHNIRASTQYRTLLDPPNFAALLADCDWVVTNGGGCMFEALYLEKPTYVLPQNDAERRIAEFARQQGGVLGIGLQDLRKFSADELRTVCETATRLVDGGGARRISNIITGFL